MFFRLSRYLVSETFGLYLFAVGAFCLLLSIDFLASWSRIIVDYEASIKDVSKLILFKIPFFLHMSMPIASVFAVLLATGRLAKDSELKAAYTLGVPPLKLLLPLLGVGFTISLLSLVNNSYLEPKSEVAHDKVYFSLIKQRPPTEKQLDASYIVENQGIYFAGEIEADQDNNHFAQLKGVLVAKDDGSIISAKEGTWDSNKKIWILKKAQIVDIEGQRSESAKVKLPFEVETEVSLSLAKEETLTIIELWQRLRNEQRAGHEISELSFKFNRQIADAFNALIFVLIASVLGLHLKGRSTGFAWTIMLIVIFYFIWTLAGNLFEEGLLSAFTAAWFTSFVVGSIGVALAFIRLR